MEMLFMGLSIAMFGLAIASLAFGAATRTETPAPPAEIQPVHPAPSARFFGAQIPNPLPEMPRVPIEALLLQIENHVRLEHAAAESFLDDPNATLLHSKTISTLVN